MLAKRPGFCVWLMMSLIVSSSCVAPLVRDIHLPDIPGESMSHALLDPSARRIA